MNRVNKHPIKGLIFCVIIIFAIDLCSTAYINMHLRIKEKERLTEIAHAYICNYELGNTILINSLKNDYNLRGSNLYDLINNNKGVVNVTGRLNLTELKSKTYEIDVKDSPNVYKENGNYYIDIKDLKINPYNNEYKVVVFNGRGLQFDLNELISYYKKRYESDFLMFSVNRYTDYLAMDYKIKVDFDFNYDKKTSSNQVITIYNRKGKQILNLKGI